jgi:endoribonuclease Dicer
MCLDLFYDWAALQIPWVNIQGRYYSTYNNLGPYAAEMYLYWDIKHRLENMMAEPPKSLQDHGCQGVDRTQAGVLASTQISPAMLEIEAILSGFQPFFEPAPTAQIPYSLEVEWYSPKVRVLVDILIECHTPTFQGIVFVEQRQVAACLARILPCIPRFKGTISCAELVGYGASDDGLCNRMRSDVVKLFRQGTINLRECSFTLLASFDRLALSVIATSVAEEGLDFPVSG